jgi:hypothetical protein
MHLTSDTDLGPPQPGQLARQVARYAGQFECGRYDTLTQGAIRIAAIARWAVIGYLDVAAHPPDCLRILLFNSTQSCAQIKMRPFKAGMLYFAIVLGTGFILGLVRVPFLVPRLGERYAELAEMPIMFIVIVIAARHIVRRYGLDPNVGIRLQVGFLALALAVSVELLLVTLIQSRPIAQYIASRDPVSGSVYILLLLLYALMPAMLVYKTSGKRK